MISDIYFYVNAYNNPNPAYPTDRVSRTGCVPVIAVLILVIGFFPDLYSVKKGLGR